MNLGLKELGGNILTTFVRQGLAIVVGLGLTIVLARTLGPQGNGQYALALLLPVMLSTLLNFGVAPANVFFLGRGSVSVRRALSVSIRLWLVLSSIGIVVGAAVVQIWGAVWFSGVPNTLLWFTLLSFPIILLQSFLVSLLQGAQDFKRFNAVSLITPVLTFSFVAVTVLGLRWGVVGAVASFFTANGISLLISVWALQPHLGELTKVSEDDISATYATRLISYAWKAHLSNILAFLNYRADVLLINIFLTPASVGIYVVAVQIAERMWVLSQAVSTVLLPRLSQLHQDATKQRELTALISRWVFAVSIAAATLVAGLSSPLILTLFGRDYAPAINALLWLLPGVVLGSVARILANDLAARGRPDLNMYASLVVVSVNIALNLFLIPRMGIIGAAIATTLAYTFNAAIKIWLYTHFTKGLWWQPLMLNRTDLQLFRKGVTYLKKGKAL